jgi:hypothetical protein
MERYAAAAGFAVLHAAFYNYFDLRYGFHASAKTGSRAPRWVQRIKYALYRALPGSLKPGLTLVLQRRDDEETSV